LNQEYRELLIGCGNRRVKILFEEDKKEWANLTTLDFDPDCNPDVLWDLDNLPYPFKDNYFDEIHAYEVLEHCGKQGDWVYFFNQFSEFWRILKPGGNFYATVPNWNEIWCFGDPGHTRVINDGTLIFLSQEQYKIQVGVTAMTDYRNFYKADFETTYLRHAESFMFSLKAIKP